MKIVTDDEMLASYDTTYSDNFSHFKNILTAETTAYFKLHCVKEIKLTEFHSFCLSVCHTDDPTLMYSI